MSIITVSPPIDLTSPLRYVRAVVTFPDEKGKASSAPQVVHEWSNDPSFPDAPASAEGDEQ
jgi:hypothetical protein